METRRYTDLVEKKLSFVKKAHMRDELRALIRDDIGSDAMETQNIMEPEVGSFQSRGKFRQGDKIDRLGEPIYNG